MHTVPFALLFALLVASLAVAIEAGFRLGRASHRRSDDEKESPVSARSGAD